MVIINFNKEIDNYIESLDRKEITKHSYRIILIQFTNFLYKKKILLPNKRDIISYKEYLSKRIGSATIQKTIVVLRGFFRYLKMNDKYEDIMYGIRGLRIEKTFKRNSLDVGRGILRTGISLERALGRQFSLLSIINVFGDVRFILAISNKRLTTSGLFK